MNEKNPPAYKKRQKELILKALTDPRFRKLLGSNPVAALGKKVTATQLKEIKIVLAAVKGIEAQISHIADELLCANGGCGVASA